MSSLDATAFDLLVLARTPAADGVVLLELAAMEGGPLPSWLPGSHVDVILPSGDARQYSLCGEPGAGTWRIGVLREEAGRGGSLWLSDTVVAGDTLRVAGPRNHFEFVPERGTRYVFIAGGIGITPIRRMLDAAAAGAVDYELHYAGRSRATMALLDEVLAAHPGRVHVYAADEGARLDLAALYGDMAPFTTTYCCGPARLIEAVETAAVGRQVKVERFEPKEFGRPCGPSRSRSSSRSAGRPSSCRRSAACSTCSRRTACSCCRAAARARAARARHASWRARSSTATRSSAPTSRPRTTSSPVRLAGGRARAARSWKRRSHASVDGFRYAPAALLNERDACAGPRRARARRR